ncbi:MAG: hypothetical protein Q9187_003960 [Circinaria calcarea]
MASPGRLSRLPLWLSRWFGYRQTPRKISDLSNALWSFIGAFCGLSILAAVFGHTQYFIDHHVPEVVASFGASTVLLYGAIESPLAQPRALIGGHIISSVVGVCTSKVFSLIPSEQRLESLRWLAGALSTATSIVLMEITATTHPPAGATALLAAINADVYNMGWYLIPVILLSTMLMLVLAMIINNIQRRYPMFWFEPAIPPVAQSSPGLGAPEKRTSTLKAFVPDRFGSTYVEMGLYRKPPFLPVSSSHTMVDPSRLSTASSAKTARLTRRYSM